MGIFSEQASWRGGEYAGNFIYKDTESGSGPILQFFNQPEGYITPDGSGGYEYVYQHKDHLGNIRLSYSDANGDGQITVSADPMVTEIVEENNYYPFGLKHRGYNFGTAPIGNSLAQKWKFGDKELTEDLGLNTIDYGWRDFDPTIARFSRIDRFAEKYENLTPYHFTANNPLIYLEINGDSLDVANDRKSRRDIRRLVRGRNRKYLKFNEDGSVSLDFSKLGANKTAESILADDEGLNLINDVVSSDKNYLYEASDVLLARDESGNKARQEMFRDPNGIVNASENGEDSSGGHTVRPREGYDGQLVISPRARYYETDSEGNEVRKSRTSVVFHELGENYERTNNRVNYNGSPGAHQLSTNRESNYHGKSNMPGQVTKIVNPKPGNSTRRKNVQKMSNY